MFQPPVQLAVSREVALPDGHIGTANALHAGMHLIMIHLPYPLPVMAYDSPDHPQGEAIRIERPTHDPQSLGLMPGMEGNLEFDDGGVQRIRISELWTSHHAGGELRIRIQSLPVDAEMSGN